MHAGSCAVHLDSRVCPLEYRVSCGAALLLFREKDL